ncbi:hypothetical protein TURU_013277 [Turdus rufiventris]|nr:hypothetical protein TURU_013277 [Turdus rufiventris]
MQPLPSWNIQRPSYVNLTRSGQLSDQLPPREATNLMAQHLPLQQALSQPMAQPETTMFILLKDNSENGTPGSFLNRYRLRRCSHSTVNLAPELEVERNFCCECSRRSLHRKKSAELIPIIVHDGTDVEVRVYVYVLPDDPACSTSAWARRSSSNERQGDKFTLRATAAYPPIPIQLTWKSSDPVYVEQRPIPEPQMSALLQLVQRELQKEHIEPSVSPWNTPVFVIPKNSGEGFRLLHDLRAVNKKIQPMGQPCAVIDIKDCFFSIPLHEQDKERFAFSIVFPNGQQLNLRFQWKVLHQGMLNSPTICQTVVSQALAPIRSAIPQATVIQYMDDILIAAPLPSQINSLVTTVSEVLKANGFEIAEAKINRGPSVTFLGMKIKSSSEHGHPCLVPPRINSC